MVSVNCLLAFGYIAVVVLIAHVVGFSETE
jgi:hypothetical protein